MHYIIVSETGTADLEEAVQEKIEQGYRPQGGIAMAALMMKRYDEEELVVMYSQAMVNDRK